MTDVFFSYSRKNIEKVKPFYKEFTRSNVDVWIDLEVLPASAGWWDELKRLITKSHSFACFLSPAWMHSPQCQAEFSYARMTKKWIIPLVLEQWSETDVQALVSYQGTDTDGNPVNGQSNWQALNEIQHIPLDTDGLAEGVNQFLSVFFANADYVREHTRFYLHAQMWEENGRKADDMLQAEHLTQAETWLASSNRATPPPTELHKEFIEASRLEAIRSTRARGGLFRWLIKPRQKLFISYRRADSSDATGRIYDRLESAFGRKNVFFDVDTIPAGADFAQVIRQSFGECFAVLVVIGPRWFDILKQRESYPEPDYVRIEVQTALRFPDLNVIPLLVGGASMPKSVDFPKSIQSLSMRNAREIRAGRDFHRDMNTLITELKRLKATTR